MFRWIKFNAVGLVGFALQSSVLFVLTHGPRPIGYLPATALAVELAVLNNFLWHQRWTWKDRPTTTRKETWRRLMSFHVTNGVLPITGNLVFMALLVGGFHLPVIAANLMSVSALSIFNYLLADRVAFQAK